MNAEAPVIRQWLADKPQPGLQRQIARVASLAGVRHVAVMPDAHQGPVAPNGIVVASDRLIYPALVGADIGCGLSALRLRGPTEGLDLWRLEALLPAMRDRVPTIKHASRRPAPELPSACPADGLSHPSLRAAARREGCLEFATLGRGNHFIELDRDDQGELWLLVHSGSRAMGQAIARHHLAQAGSLGAGDVAALALAGDAGGCYLADQGWAVRYASENRLAIANRIADLLESRFALAVDEASWIDCPHNFVRLEQHGGQELAVHRKSANSARHGEAGIIPGSMATGARIVRGLGSLDSLNSSSHGSGRRLSRGEAAGRLSVKAFTDRMGGVVFDRSQAAGLLDEAPQAYRDLDRVMQAQRDLVKTVARLTPVLNDKRV